MLQARAAARPPGWVLAGAAFDLDFQNGRWWGGTVADRTNFGSLITISNGGVNGAYGAPDRTGRRVHLFDANRPRVVPGLGLWVEHNSHNRLLHSRDLTQAAWVASNCTVVRDQAGADFDATANTGSLITATSANGTVLQSITLAAGTGMSSAYVRRMAGRHIRILPAS